MFSTETINEPVHEISNNVACATSKTSDQPAQTRSLADQCLCLSLEYSMTVKLLTEHHLEFLSLKGGCTGSPECTLVKMPHCWKSHVVAQFSCDEENSPVCPLFTIDMLTFDTES